MARGAYSRCAGVKRRAQKAQRCSVLASAETSASSFLWKRRDVILSLGAGRMRGDGWAEGVEVDGDGFVLDRCERIFIR